MKRLALLFLLLLSENLALADDFTEKFEAIRKAGDRAATVEFLEKAAETESENPEFYAAAGNYWWSAGGSVAITPVPAGNFELDPKSLSIIDPKTGKKVGSIGKAGTPDPEQQKKALGILTGGARKFPQRADIALGLAHIQKKMGLKEGYVNTLTAFLAEAGKDPKALVWKEGGDLPSPAEIFIPETVQGYTAALFNANTPATDALCGKLLSAITEAFPDHPYAYNLGAALADATGKPEEAIRLLETARQKAPDDPLILLNLAGAHVKSGQKEKAVAVYEAVLKLKADPGSHRKARAALEKLGKTGPAKKPEADDSAKEKK